MVWGVLDQFIIFRILAPGQLSIWTLIGGSEDFVMLERLKSPRTRTGFLIAGSFHSPFRRVFMCLCGALAKLDMRVCGDVC